MCVGCDLSANLGGHLHAEFDFQILYWVIFGRSCSLPIYCEPSIGVTMRDVIVLDDDEEGAVSCSQAQRGLSEAQRMRMIQQKQLALARLTARKVQQAPISFRGSVSPPQRVSSSSIDLRIKPLAGGSREVTSTSMGDGWRARPTSDDWNHFRLSDQGCHNHFSNSVPFYQGSHSSSSNADGSCADRFDGQHSHSSSTYNLEPCKDGNRGAVPNRNQEYWDADFDQGTQAVPSLSDSRQNSTHVSTEVVGEWRSVRKRPAPGSSFGRQVSASSNQFKPPAVTEHWQIFKSLKTSPDAARPIKQQPGILMR